MFFEKLLRIMLCMIAIACAPIMAQAIEFSVAEYDGPAQCAREADSLGIRHCVIYVRLGSSTRLNTARLPDGFEATIVIKLSEDYDTPHTAMLDGQYDGALRRLADQINADGRRVTIRLMAEGNAYWNYDGAYRKGQSPESYRKAYVYAVDFLRGVIRPDLIRDLELNLNFASFGYDKKRIETNDFAALDPGEGYRTLVSFSGYNRCGTTSDFKEVRRFDDLFAKAITQAHSAFPGVPLGIAEIGSTPYCGVDLLAWWSDALAKAKAAGLVRVGLFLNPDPDIGETDQPERWDAILTEHPREFQELLQRFGAGASQPTEQRGDLGVAPDSLRQTSFIPKEPSLFAKSGWNFPWEVWADVRQTWGDEPIPGYGTAGLVAQGTFRQSALKDFGRFEIGPSILFGYVQSNNCADRYWQCQVRAELSLRAVTRPFEDFGDYRRLDFNVGVGHREYTEGAPDRLNGGDTYGFAGVTFIMGGDWKK